MDSHEHDEQKRIEEPFEVEISDLGMSETVEGGKSSGLKHTFVDWQQISRRQCRGLVGALGVLVLAVLVILLSLDTGLSSLFLAWVSPHSSMNPSGPLQIKPSTQILLEHNGFGCIWDSAWSPDSKRFAVLGYRTCPGTNDTFASGQVAVYDAHSGQLVKRLMPDAAILHALRSGSPEVRGVPEILYESVLWSPDGNYLAMLFSIDMPNEAGPSFEGVLLSNENSGYTRVMLQRYTNASQNIIEWDLEHGKPAKTVPVPSPIEAPFADVPPAFAYQWGRDGVLLPQMAVTNAKLPAKTPLDPVGNPVGGISFTIWQSGMVVLYTGGGDGSIQKTGVYTWSTVFPAWSPDGRYLLNFIYVNGRLELPGQPPPSQQTLSNLQLDHAPLLAVRDVAFQRLVETMHVDVGSSEALLLSWRPDGRVLAATSSFFDTVSLFDCATGKERALLVLPTYLGNVIGGETSLRWSPDGSQLLAFAPGRGAMVWNVKYD